MSVWSYIQGVIEVHPRGYSTPQTRFVLETTLNHLPVVKGSELNMNVHIIPRDNMTASSPWNEFGEFVPDCFSWQVSYWLLLDGELRDVGYEDCKKQFMKWMCRLAKRMYVNDITVKIHSTDAETGIIIRDSEPFRDMCEYEGTLWPDFMLWDTVPLTDFPRKLAEYEDERR